MHIQYIFHYYCCCCCFFFSVLWSLKSRAVQIILYGWRFSENSSSVCTGSSFYALPLCLVCLSWLCLGFTLNTNSVFQCNIQLEVRTAPSCVGGSMWLSLRHFPEMWWTFCCFFLRPLIVPDVLLPFNIFIEELIIRPKLCQMAQHSTC